MCKFLSNETWDILSIQVYYSKMNAKGPHWLYIDIGSGNGLLPSGNKPLSEPMLTEIYVYIASLGHNELNQSYR